ncbi:MAG TPA: hypothetical protein GX401_03410 [Clostridiales bacterium]|nr:hypothetical protein [Clostridiales bacterium]
MIKIKLMILDSDEIYLERFTSVLNTKYQDKIEVHCFSNVQYANLFLVDNKVDVFLCAENINFDKKVLMPNCGFAYFCDKKSINQVDGAKAIGKYQKIELIYSQILDLFSENSSYKVSEIEAKGLASDKFVYLFMSAAGGTGSSTLAAASSMRLAKKGEKILYINLELLGDCKEFFVSEGHGNLSDLIYAIKSNNANIALKIESLIKNTKVGVDFLECCSSPLDIRDIKDKDINILIDTLLKLTSYTKIIIDADFSLQDISLSLFNVASSIILVSDGEKIANDKTIKLLETFGIIEKQNKTPLLQKVKIAYNKFSSKNAQQIVFDDVKSIGGTPRFDGAVPMQIAEQIANMAFLDNI